MEKRTENNLVEVEPKKSGRGQYERKARGSYKTIEERRITIKHYIDTKSKVVFWGYYNDYENHKSNKNDAINYCKQGQTNYPYYNVYVRISLKGQTTNLKSGIVLPVEENLERNSDLLENTKIIKLILDKLKPFERESFNIKEFTKVYDLLNSNVSEIILNILHNEYKKLYSDMMMESGYTVHSYDNDFSTSFIMSFIKDEENHLIKYNEGIWGLSEYEKILKIRMFRRNYCNPELGFYFNSERFLFGRNFKICKLISFIDGTYQDEMIKMFGKEMMQPIIDDIYFILKQNFKEFEIMFVK